MPKSIWEKVAATMVCGFLAWTGSTLSSATNQLAYLSGIYTGLDNRVTLLENKTK